MEIKSGTKVAIVGSRNYPKLYKVRELVFQLPDNCIVISGGARGVDRTAEMAAKEKGLLTIVFPADWKKYGKGAGLIRNQQIIKACDLTIAFWDGISPGTEHSISLANKLSKPVQIYN